MFKKATIVGTVFAALMTPGYAEILPLSLTFDIPEGSYFEQEFAHTDNKNDFQFMQLSGSLPVGLSSRTIGDRDKLIISGRPYYKTDQTFTFTVKTVSAGIIDGALVIRTLSERTYTMSVSAPLPVEPETPKPVACARDEGTRFVFRYKPKVLPC